MLTREELLAASGRRTIEPVPNGDGESLGYVRTLTAGEKDRFEAIHSRDPMRDFRARVVVACLCDEAGKPIFNEEDIPVVSGVDPQTLDPIVKAALRLNKMSEQDEDDLRKN